MKWSTAGFDPASSACKADVLPNELRPQSCRDPIRTGKIPMYRHRILSAIVQYKDSWPFKFSDLNRITNVTGLILTKKLAVRVTSLMFRTHYSEQDFWIMWAVICFCCKCPVFFEIENVGLEPLLCLPGAACSLNTSFSATPAGIEPAPPERQSGVLTVIRWSYIFVLPWSYLIRVSCTFLRT